MKSWQNLRSVDQTRDIFISKSRSYVVNHVEPAARVVPLVIAIKIHRDLHKIFYLAAFQWRRLRAAVATDDEQSREGGGGEKKGRAMGESKRIYRSCKWRIVNFLESPMFI